MGRNEYRVVIFRTPSDGSHTVLEQKKWPAIQGSRAITSQQHQACRVVIALAYQLKPAPADTLWSLPLKAPPSETETFFFSPRMRW